MQGKGNERAQNKKRNGESRQENVETQQREGTAPCQLGTESCSQPEAKPHLLCRRTSPWVPWQAHFPGCNGYRAGEAGGTGDFARGGTAVSRSGDILLDLKEKIFLCSPNTCLTSSWSRTRGEERYYSICRYLQRRSPQYDALPRTTVPAGRSAVLGHCSAILAALAGLAPSPQLCFCNPAPSTHHAEGTSRRSALPGEETKCEKLHGQTQPLLQKADARPNVRVRHKAEA